MANVIAGADIVGRRPMSVLILGHSFVSRLDLYLKGSNLAPNLNISQGVDINLLGLRPIILDGGPALKEHFAPIYLDAERCEEGGW